MRQYGGVWGEFRAYVAVVLFSWALTICPDAVLDLAEMLAINRAVRRSHVRGGVNGGE